MSAATSPCSEWRARALRRHATKPQSAQRPVFTLALVYGSRYFIVRRGMLFRMLRETDETPVETLMLTKGTRTEPGVRFKCPTPFAFRLITPRVYSALQRGARRY